MIDSTMDSIGLGGHPLSILEIHIDEIDQHGDLIEAIFETRHSGVVVRNAFPVALVRSGVERLGFEALAAEWSSPNRGMKGGEIRVMGDAATPTFTARGGPTAEAYARSASLHRDRCQKAFGDGAEPTRQL